MIAHDERAGAVIALDEELRLAQDPDVARRPPGSRPTRPRAGPATRRCPGPRPCALLVEAALGGLDVARVAPASGRARAARTRVFSSRRCLELPRANRSIAVGDQRVHEGVARQHVVDDHVVQRVAPRAQGVVDAVELPLQRRRDASTRGQIARRRWSGASWSVDPVQRGQGERCDLAGSGM